MKSNFCHYVFCYNTDIINKKLNVHWILQAHKTQSLRKLQRLLRLATYASVSVAVILIVVKLIAWGRSDSVSLLATLVDSVLDAFASIINLVAVRHALTPADKEHRFGHGKAEALRWLKPVTFYCRIFALFYYLRPLKRCLIQLKSNMPLPAL